MTLPESVTKVLESFVLEAKSVFLDRLVAVILYGSAAEGRLRKTSDVNVLVVSKSFTSHDAEALSGILSLSAAAVDLQVMFLLESEINTASQLFAVKFSDISRRRQVLFGEDPFAKIIIDREALITRLRQVLLNHLLRLRYVFTLQHESIDKLRILLTESIAPLRAAAASILELRQQSFSNSKQALEILAKEIAGDRYLSSLMIISEEREGQKHSFEQVKNSLSVILELTVHLKDLVKSLSK
jgi:predicted nucleotidyltransferase